MNTVGRTKETPIIQAIMLTWKKMESTMIPSKLRAYLLEKNYLLSNSYLEWTKEWFKLSRLLKGLKNKENKGSIIVRYRKKRVDQWLGLVLKIHLTSPKWAMLTLQLMIEVSPLLWNLDLGFLEHLTVPIKKNIWFKIQDKWWTTTKTWILVWSKINNPQFNLSKTQCKKTKNNLTMRTHLIIKLLRSKFLLTDFYLVLKVAKEVSRADRPLLFKTINLTQGVRQMKLHSWLETRYPGLHTKNSELYNESILTQIICLI